MAKYRRLKKYTRRSRNKWCSNIKEIPTSQVAVPAEQGPWYFSYTLCTNPTQSDAMVSQIYTIKHLELQFETDWSNAVSQTSVEDICYYIMFLPQGMILSTDYNLEHPEYILGYRYYGSPSNDTNDKYFPIVRTKLAKKLQTGDSIILFIKGYNTSSQSATVYIHGLLKWWSKAN